MNITAKIEHKSKIGADVAYTSYEWSLSHWSLLYDHYNNSVSSPEFEIVRANVCKCVLVFQLAKSEMEVRFLKKFEFHTLQANVSILDKKKRKLLTVKSTRIKSVDTPIKIRFPLILGEHVLAQYLVNDTLIFFFELYIVKSIIESPVTNNTWDSKYLSIAPKKLEDMLKDGDLCDVTFLVEEQLIPAHKVILAMYSDVFRAMFMSQMKEQKEGTVEIKDVTAEVFKVFLRYMYTGSIEDVTEVVTDLIVVADKYQVLDLINDCESYMVAHLYTETATQYLFCAHRFHLTSLEDEAVKFMKQNTQILADPVAYDLLSHYPTLVSRIFES